MQNERSATLKGLVSLIIVGLCVGVAQGAGPIDWDDFSGSENWIDFGSFDAMPNPTYYEGCVFTEQGDGLGGPGWQFHTDHYIFFETGAATYPGMSLGRALIDAHGRTEIKVEFTGYSGVRHVGILGTTSMASTYALEAYDVGNNLLYSVTDTMPANSTPIWLGIEADADISYVLITEPADNGYYAIFDDLRFDGNFVFLDTDGDGIYDQYDECPGSDPCVTVDHVGCLDSNGDGISDANDVDGDGVANAYDECADSDPCFPVDHVGCLDTDGDGVSDSNDICPDSPGGVPILPNGCPDTDDDGIDDSNDACPSTPPCAPVDANGCVTTPPFVSIMSTSATAWGDYNNDGYSDMFGGVDVYTNQGDGTFVMTSPLGGRQRGSLGDWNNDGYLDAFDMVPSGAPVLWLNDGNEGWINKSDLIIAGVLPRGSNGIGCADFNGDGYLDGYMTGWYYSGIEIADVLYTSYINPSGDPCWSHTFTAPSTHTKGATACDFDEDGDQDLYVSGYFMNPGILWLNDGFGGLTDVASAYGVDDGPGHTQGSCWGDFDNDGDFDLFIANFAHPGNPTARFMENQGAPDYHFTNKGLCGIDQNPSANPLKLEPLSCGIAGDYDNDGDLDILITVSSGYSWTTIIMYRNNGDWTFTDVTCQMGLGEQGPQDAAAWGDFDNDGDLDLIAAGQLWRNSSGSNHWLKVKLNGGPHAEGLVNGAAIGAQVRIAVPGLGTLTRQVEGNTGQLGSQNDLILHFGLGSYSATVDLDISWPNGYQETIYDVAVDQAITVQLGDPHDCGEVIAMGCRLDGDFDSSCYVTVDDLWVLAGLWLADCGVEDCSVVDIDGSSTIGLDDFSRYVDNLGQCNEPYAAGCVVNW